MSDYREQGAVPVEDRADDNVPTVDEVLERQRAEYPEQAASSTLQPAPTPEELAAVEAGGEPTGERSGEGVDIEGPNSA